MSDAPDWQRIVQLISGGTLTDAPDWERVVTGPGGAALGGVTWSTSSWSQGSTVTLPAASTTTVNSAFGLGAGWYMVASQVIVHDTSGADNWCLCQAALSAGSFFHFAGLNAAVTVPASGYAVLTRTDWFQITATADYNLQVSVTGAAQAVSTHGTVPAIDSSYISVVAFA